MVRICHLLDASCGWEQRVGLTQLVQGLAPNRFHQTVACLHPSAFELMKSLDPAPKLIARQRGGWLAAPAVARFVSQNGFDLIHAWGAPSTIAASMACTKPTIVQLYDPAETTKTAKVIRSIARRNRLVASCGAETVRRRLIERGVATDDCVTIRPGVDFQAINRWRTGSLRETMGVEREHLLVSVPPSTQPGDWLDITYRAVKMSDYLDGGYRIATRRTPDGGGRVHWIEAGIQGPHVGIPVPSETPFEAIVAVADVLVVPDGRDPSTTSITWAMASDTVVIAAACYSVAEIISHKLNGLLYSQRSGGNPAIPVIQLLRDRRSQQKVKEVARGHAYEVFSLGRCLEQHAKLYDLVISGKPIAGEFADAALLA